MLTAARDDFVRQHLAENPRVENNRRGAIFPGRNVTEGLRAELDVPATDVGDTPIRMILQLGGPPGEVWSC
jgi:hypothetical protein